MRTHFSMLEDATRMKLRDAIEKTGAYVDGYSGAFVRVALPNPASDALTQLQRQGFHLHLNEISYYPLVTDAPPDRLRHHGPRQWRRKDSEKPGYWAYVFLWHDAQNDNSNHEEKGA